MELSYQAIQMQQDDGVLTNNKFGASSAELRLAIEEKIALGIKENNVCSMKSREY